MNSHPVGVVVIMGAWWVMTGTTKSFQIILNVKNAKEINVIFLKFICSKFLSLWNLIISFARFYFYNKHDTALFFIADYNYIIRNLRRFQIFARKNYSISNNGKIGMRSLYLWVKNRTIWVRNATIWCKKKKKLAFLI